MVRTAVDMLPAFMGQAPVIRGMVDAMKRVARTMSGVLVVGETGTGKGLVARAIHDMSVRAGGPFVVMGCSALAAQGIGGAWSLGQEADGGTLFLDEISNLALELQLALLGLLQLREATPSRGAWSSDYRLIASSNVDLEHEVHEGRFRADLFFRLSAFPIRVPPLRERRQDIPALANAIRDRFAREYATVPPEIPPHVMRELVRYPWPGNVRELENTLERAMLVHAGRPAIELTAEELQSAWAGEAPPDDDRWALATIERDHVLKVLQSVKGHQGRAAAILRISRRTLYRKLREWSGHDADPSL